MASVGGRLLLNGGLGEGQGDVWAYTPGGDRGEAPGVWEREAGEADEAAGGPGRRVGHSLIGWAAGGREGLVMYGGRAAAGVGARPAGGGGHAVFGDAWWFDLAGRTWRRLQPVGPGGGEAAAPVGRLYHAGGVGWGSRDKGRQRGGLGCGGSQGRACTCVLPATPRPSALLVRSHAGHAAAAAARRGGAGRARARASPPPGELRARARGRGGGRHHHHSRPDLHRRRARVRARLRRDAHRLGAAAAAARARLRHARHRAGRHGVRLRRPPVRPGAPAAAGLPLLVGRAGGTAGQGGPAVSASARALATPLRDGLARCVLCCAVRGARYVNELLALRLGGTSGLPELAALLRDGGGGAGPLACPLTEAEAADEAAAEQPGGAELASPLLPGDSWVEL
jgi:hypothetical protein